MSILVMGEHSGHGCKSFELACDKKQAYISYHEGMGRVNVCCLNVSHRVWRGMGRFFGSWDEAKAAYKSRAMVAMIELAEELSQGGAK